VAVAPRCHGAAPPHCVAHSVATALAAAGMPTTTQVTASTEGKTWM
jgi:hypothetical protein